MGYLVKCSHACKPNTILITIITHFPLQDALFTNVKALESLFLNTHLTYKRALYDVACSLFLHLWSGFLGISVTTVFIFFLLKRILVIVVLLVILSWVCEIFGIWEFSWIECVFGGWVEDLLLCQVLLIWGLDVLLETWWFGLVFFFLVCTVPWSEFKDPNFLGLGF